MGSSPIVSTNQRVGNSEIVASHPRVGCGSGRASTLAEVAAAISRTPRLYRRDGPLPISREVTTQRFADDLTARAVFVLGTGVHRFDQLAVDPGRHDFGGAITRAQVDFAVFV